MPPASRARRSASSPLATPMLCEQPQYSAKASSNWLTCGPSVNVPDSINSTTSPTIAPEIPACCGLRSMKGTLGAPRRTGQAQVRGLVLLEEALLQGDCNGV